MGGLTCCHADVPVLLLLRLTPPFCSLWCSGSNTDGQLGSSPSVESDTFREATSLTNVAAEIGSARGGGGGVKAVAVAGGGRCSVVAFDV
jgi:hypothetical protein